MHALVACYRERGIHITCTGEPARTSPFIEDIVIHGQGNFDLTAEIDTFAAMPTTQLRAARHHSVLVTDKTTLNVIAYARLLLPREDQPAAEAMLGLSAVTAGM